MFVQIICKCIESTLSNKIYDEHTKSCIFKPNGSPFIKTVIVRFNTILVSFWLKKYLMYKL